MSNHLSIENACEIVPADLFVRRLLLEAGQKLSPASRASILDLKSSGIPPLLRILEDEELQMSEAPGQGWAPIHAAELLIELRATGTVGPLLRILASTDPLDILHDRIISELGSLGEALVEPALKAPTHGDEGLGL